MNLLDGLIGGIRSIYENGTEKTFKRGLDFADMAITEASDRLSLVVAGIRGVPVSATVPMTDQVLAYDGTQWTPKTLDLANDPQAQKPSLSRSTCSWMDLADTLAELNLIELTGSWPSWIEVA